jgi:hypothetical protein
MLRPIQGPGMCGADFPLKVSVLGESPILGFADDSLRPPGAIPQYSPAYPRALSAPPIASSAPYAPDPQYVPAGDAYPQYAPADGPSTGPGAPLSLMPPGLDQQRGEPQYSVRPVYGAPPAYPPPQGAPATVPLGPARGPAITASIGPTAVNPPATLACPIVSVLDRWITEAVQPAALRWFGQPVAEIKQISAYSCRGMNGDPRAHISEHAFGNALDIAAFTLADGRRITVKDGWHGLPEEQGFLRDVQNAACQFFATVLAPGANVYHYDHMHVDLMRRASGRRICEPAAISGEVAAARARARYAGPRYSDPGITGSVRAQPADGRPMAVPGED